MNNSFRLYRTILTTICQILDPLRATRQRNLARLIVGLYQSRHVHLTKIASHLPGPAKLNSKVQQLRRFVANAAIDPVACYAPYARQIINAAAASGRLKLLIDTTNLSGGRQILMVALAYRRRALPVIWQVMRRKGVTDAKTQCALLETLRAWLPPSPALEVILIGDGEFHSVDLMAWLVQQGQGWHFRLRLHADTFIRLAGGTWIQLQNLGIQPGDRCYRQHVYLTQHKHYGPVNIAIVWDPTDEKPWYIATDEPADHSTLLDYSRRMWIDEMFGDFKEGHFHLHQSRLRQPDRLSRLLLALCITYTWLMHLGAYVIKRGWRHQVDRPDRRDRSLPSIGLLWLQRCLNLEEPEHVHVGFRPYF